MTEPTPCQCGTCFDCRFRTAQLSEADQTFIRSVEMVAGSADLNEYKRDWMARDIHNISENIRLGYVQFAVTDEAAALRLAGMFVERARMAYRERPKFVWLESLLPESERPVPGRFVEVNFGTWAVK